MNQIGKFSQPESKSAMEALSAIAARHLNSLGNSTECQELLRDDALLVFRDSGEIIYGRDEICAVFDNLHCQLFAGTSRIRTSLTRDQCVAIEATFHGTHRREIAGVRPTGRSVSADYALAYEFEQGAIAEIRAYWSLDALVRQLRGG